MNASRERLEQIFDRFCRTNGIGMRYEHRRPELQWVLSLVEQTRHRTNLIASFLAQQLGIGTIHVDVADSPVFNAFATIDADVYMVGITDTILRCLYPLTAIVARYYEPTTPLEQPIKERLQGTNWTAPESVISCCAFLEQFGPLVPADSRQRHVDLFWAMMNLIIHHEYAHLYCGHVAFQNDQSGMAKLGEADTTPHSYQQLRHAMEIQADIGICLYLVALKQRQPEPELDLVLLASYILFSILYTLAAEESGSHPHPMVRLILLLNRFSTEAQIDVDEARQRIGVRIDRLGLNFFEYGINRTPDELHRAAAEIEEASNNKYMALFEPYRLKPMKRS